MASKIKSYICRFLNIFSNPQNDLTPIISWERFYGSDEMSLMEKIRTNVYNNLNYPKIIKWYNGLKFVIYPNSDLGRAFFISGTYEPNSLLVVKNALTENSVFFDIGANAGVFTLAASQWVGPKGLVVAFEPSAREYQLLEENVTLNQLSNVRLEKLAISNTNGSALLNIATQRHNGQNTLCREFAYEGVDSGTAETVSIRTLDQYISEKEISRLDLIKLDIEGAEYNALLGAKNILTMLRPILIFEIVKSALQKNGIDIAEIEAFLDSLGYKTFSIDEATARLVPKCLFEMKDGNAVAMPSEKINIS